MDDEFDKKVPSILNMDNLEHLKKEYPSFLAIVFYSDTSPRSRDALSTITEIKDQKSGVAVASVNVSRVRDIHPIFGVTGVPSVITLKNGTLSKRVEGIQQKSTYEALFDDAPRKRADGTEAPPLRVTVYSSPTCPPCGVVKSYLRKKGVSFRVVDISLDEHSAREIMSRTGVSAVPQTDINGTVVVGADIPKIEKLLRL